MGRFLFQYHAVSPTTWAYLSTLLMIGLFFKFSRLWSVRNLDLLLLSLLAPGLLLVHVGQVKQNPVSAAYSTVAGVVSEQDVKSTNPPEDGDAPSGVPDASDVSDASASTDDPTDASKAAIARRLEALRSRGGQLERAGHIWLFVTGLFWLARMLTDTRLTRRPLLSPNLSVGGMAFIGVALFIFLSGNVIYRAAIVDAQNAATTKSTKATQTTAEESGDAEDTEALAAALAAKAVPAIPFDPMNARMEQFLTFQQPARGPGYSALDALPAGATKTIAICSHLAIVLGLILISYRHFGNFTNGIGAATLYLMIPYTSQLTGRIEHCLPAAFLIWAIFYYRRPLVSGLLIGAAVGCIYYPLFLLPLWISFYWKRGGVRFVIGVVFMLVALAVALPFAPGSGGFAADLKRMFGVLFPAMEGLEGLWNTQIGGWDPTYRLPVLVGCAVFACSLMLWPAQKNLGTLISCSAAVMLCSQFWHGYGGGLFIAWYLPLTVLMIFRPNLEDRVAQMMLSETMFRRRSGPA